MKNQNVQQAWKKTENTIHNGINTHSLTFKKLQSFHGQCSAKI